MWKYHLGKTNIVADALSRKSYKPKNAHLQEEMARLNVHVIPQNSYCKLSVQPTLESKIREAQSLDMNLMKIRKQIGENKASDFRVGDKRTLWYKDRICVPKEGDFRHTIMDEAHKSAYSIHPGATKMYMDLKQKYWWNGIKGEIAQFVTHCDTCQRIKAEHQKQAGLLQPLPIPVWKWDEIIMDFVVGLPRTRKGNDSIWVMVDQFTKVAHYLLVRTNYGGERLAQLFVDNIVKLHGAPSRIVSNRGTQFTSRFWKGLHKAMGSKLNFNSAYHPQTDGQTERVNQIMEDMLRSCVLTYGKDWEQSLPYVEFSYNNSYQASLDMSPFEARYGRKCRTPLMWSEVRECTLVRPDLIKEAEDKVAEIREKLKVAQSRQKSYADKKRREVSFTKGDLVYLKVSPIRGTRRFQVQGKLAPRYIGPYQVLDKVGAVAYRIKLPEEMSDIYPAFHVSQLRRCLKEPETQHVPVEVIDLQKDLQYQEIPVKIFDTVTKRTRNSEVQICRVQWSRHEEKEATWEREDALRRNFPISLGTSRISRMRFILSGVGL
jgi:hypothetical protein